MNREEEQKRNQVLSEFLKDKVNWRSISGWKSFLDMSGISQNQLGKIVPILETSNLTPHAAGKMTSTEYNKLFTSCSQHAQAWMSEVHSMLEENTKDITESRTGSSGKQQSVSLDDKSVSILDRSVKLTVLVKDEEKRDTTERLEKAKLDKNDRFQRSRQESNGEYIELLEKVIRRGCLGHCAAFKLLIWSSFEGDQEFLMDHRWCLIGDWPQVKTNLWRLMQHLHPDTEGKDLNKLLECNWGNNETLREFNNKFSRLSAASDFPREKQIDLWTSKLPLMIKAMIRQSIEINHP